MNAQSRYRSPRYLAWCHGHLLEQVCPLCSQRAPSELHHYDEPGHKGLGVKCSDLRVVALCRDCHGAWHQRGLEVLRRLCGLKSVEQIHQRMRDYVVASASLYGGGLVLLAQERGAKEEADEFLRLPGVGYPTVDDVRQALAVVEALERAVDGARTKE